MRRVRQMKETRVREFVGIVGDGHVAGCAGTPKPDAYGNVEATEVVVGAEAMGRQVTFDVDEGPDARRRRGRRIDRFDRAVARA